MQRAKDQLAAMLGYLLLPMLCFALPINLGNRLAGWCSRRSWLYATELSLALNNAEAAGAVDDRETWSSQFRRVRFLDAVDLWHGLLSSRRRIARLLHTTGAWPEEGRFIAVGTHSGPGTLVLRCLADAGFTPRFVFRALPDEWRKELPVLHAYMRLRQAYIRRQCRGGEIQVPEQRHRVAEAMDAPGAALVLLVDAPGHSTHFHAIPLFGRKLVTARRGLELAQSRNALFATYTLLWNPETGQREMTIAPARRYDSAQELVSDCSAFVQATVEAHPAQWQLWSTPEQILTPLTAEGDAAGA